LPLRRLPPAASDGDRGGARARREGVGLRGGLPAAGLDHARARRRQRLLEAPARPGLLPLTSAPQAAGEQADRAFFRPVRLVLHAQPADVHPPEPGLPALRAPSQPERLVPDGLLGARLLPQEALRGARAPADGSLHGGAVGTLFLRPAAGALRLPAQALAL